MVLTRTLRVLGHRHLFVLWLAQVLSAVGDRLFELATVWLSVQLVGREAGFVLTSGALAWLSVGLLGGVLADRYHRQRLLVTADVVRCLTVLSLPLAATFGSITLVHLAVIAAVTGGLSALFEPTLQASLPALTPDSRSLQAFNALLDITARLARVVGPGLAGLLVALLPLAHFFTVDAVTFGLSALAVLALGRGYAWQPQQVEDCEERGSLRVVSELRGAFTLIAAHRPLAWTFGALLVVNLAWSAAFTVGLALLTEQAFGASIGVYGLLVAAYGIGNVPSNLVVGGLEVEHRVTLFFMGKLVLGFGFVVLALAPNVPVALTGAAVGALGGPMGDIMLLLMIQEDFPANQIGKVYSARIALSSVGSSLGLLLASPLFLVLSVRGGMLACAVLILVVGAVGLGRFYGRA